MSRISHMFRWVPFLRRRRKAERLAQMSPEQVFQEIYDNNAWKGTESVSGLGSDTQQTQHVIRQLPTMLRKLEANSVLDIPCGDCYWMQHVDLTGIRYIGADIVSDLVAQNQDRHQSSERSFVVANLLEGRLPDADVIFCRDCLVHFSTPHVWTALKNIAASKARYLITTTFSDRDNQREIETGQWRPLNLQAAPFELPALVDVIDEQCTQDGGAYPDKLLGVWAIDDLRDRLHRQQAA